MKKLTSASLLFVCVFIITASHSVYAAVSQQKPQSNSNTQKTIDNMLEHDHVTGRLLVKFKSESALNNAMLANTSDRVHRGINSKIKKNFRGMKRLQLVTIPENFSVEEALQYYLTEPDIEYAEPDYLVKASLTPNDSGYTNLWGLNNTGQSGGTADADIDAPEAWELTTGSSTVVIAVVDSGVNYNHPDLAANIWTNTGETSCTDGVDNDGNGYIDDCTGWDFVGNDNDPMDYYGHGTHVAGTIAATGNNSTGSTGVMWQARIMPLRFLGVSGNGSTSDAISAIIYATANGAHIINNSWSGTSYSMSLKDAIDASPAVVVCAAGNENKNNDTTPSYPSSYDSANIISVAATDRNDARAWFSNYGATAVDIGAPGVSIYSTHPQYSYSAPIIEHSQSFDNGGSSFNSMGWAKGGINSSWSRTSGTGIGGSKSLDDSPGGNYLSNTSSWVGYMTPISTVRDNLYTLSFSWKGELENNLDFMLITYSPNGSAWDWIDSRTGSTGGIFNTDSSEELTIIADVFDSFYFGFGMQTNATVNLDGAYIDEVTLSRQTISITGSSYVYFQGTSMAAPHVAGVAGLLKAMSPGLTNAEIKAAILDNADPVASLSGKTVTGGRLNALTALSSLGCASQPFRLLSTFVEYTSLQAAYDAALDGETIQGRDVTISEIVNFNINKSITILGGYECNFNSITGKTSISGSLNVSEGSAVMGNLIITP